MPSIAGFRDNSLPPPVVEDLLEDGVDVVFSQQLRELAKTLHHDPLEIYEYVRNHCTYQPYWGSLKGARGALAEKCGNDADLASLLISLLRISGYPARYSEALVTLDIERAKNWLGLQQDRMVGYYLATAGVPNVQELYQGASLVQVRFRHIFVEVYMPYGNYRGQQRSTLHRLWVPLAPAFKTMSHVEGRISQISLPLDPSGFLQRLQTSATVEPDGSLSGLDQNIISSILDEYRNALDDVITRENPQMTLRDLYGYSQIQERHDPILPITLPFESMPSQRYSKLPELMHHRIKIQLSYWGTDLDADEEEGGLGTQEIRYMTPTANVIGRRLTLSYKPATPADEDLLRRYDGNLFGTPCFLVHMYPQLTLDGSVVAENEHKEREDDIDNAAISLGLDENIRIELYKPGETVFPQRRSDTKITVGDFMGIVLDCGVMAREYLDASIQRFEKAVTDPTSDVEKLIGEQLFQTGCAYFYQFNAAADALAQQAGVRWFRNPSELTVSRHLQVSWLMDFFPVAVESSTILLDVTGNRIQAIPRTGDWTRREAFLRSAGQYLSLLEHTILTELYHQDAVSAVSLIQTALDRGSPVYEITPQNQSSVLPKIDLPREDIEIIERELRLGQIVLVPKSRLTVGTYTGAPIVSLTPPGNPMGAFREGYFITRCRPDPYALKASNGGQITEVVTDILNDLVAPDFKGWLSFQAASRDALGTIVMNSDAIRAGTIPVRSFLNSTTGMAISLLLMHEQAASANMLLSACSATISLLRSITNFLHDTLVMYIDFKGDSLYRPEENNGIRSAVYLVMDMLGQGKAGYLPTGTITHTVEKPLDSITSTGADGSGTFSFSYDNTTVFKAGDRLEVSLQLSTHEGTVVKTSGTFHISGLDLDIDSNNTQWLQDPSRTIEEERIEDLEGSSNYPGKIIPLNTGDMDGDGVPNFADGMNLFGNDGTDAGGNLVPVLLEIPSSANPEKTEIRFTYNQSDPADVLRYGQGNDEDPYRYAPAEGRLRLWICDGTESRNINEPGVRKGHFIKSGSVYTAPQLGGGQVMRLFVEGVSPSATPGDEVIVVESRQQGSSGGWIMRDAVRVTVLDIGIDPDFNRDGIIDDADHGRVSLKKPWRFWINDDDDGDADSERGVNDDLDDQLGLAIPDDLPGQREDNRDDHVNGIRDLVDFFPLRLRLQQALSFFPPNRYTYCLEHEDEALNILLNYATLPNAANRYLTDPDEAIGLCRGRVMRIGGKSNRYTIPESLLTAMQDTPQQSVMLFEARTISDKPLRLFIHAKGDGKIIHMQEFPLELLNVREMYYHANYRNIGCPDGKDCGGDVERLERIKKPFCMDDNKTALVWVHGYNVNGNAASATFAEVFKRFFHTNFNGNFYGLSWYSNPPVPGTTKPLPPHYHQAVVNAFNMAEYFRDFIEEVVKKTNAKVSVAAHSLGNVLVGAAIQDNNLSVDNYFAIDAAVALEAYGQNYDDNQSMIRVGNWKSYYDYDSEHDNQTGQKRLLASEWHTLFAGTDDSRHLLTWRNRFKDVVGTSMYNFYSSTEEVLATYHGDNMLFDGTWSSFADKAWVKQEKFKGRPHLVPALPNIGGTRSPFAGWGFNMHEQSYRTQEVVTTGESAVVVDRPKTPEELGILGEEFLHGLKTKPFFNPEPEELFDPLNGSTFVMRDVGMTRLRDYYKDLNAPGVRVRDWLLAEAFPATSLPMGTHINGRLDIKANNFNMSTTGNKGFMADMQDSKCPWPRRIKINDMYINQWFHSDYKDVSYQHVNKFYKKIVELSK